MDYEVMYRCSFARVMRERTENRRYVLHLTNVLIRGSGKGNIHTGDGESITLPGDKISEPRSVTLAPNGDVIITCNDSGFVRVITRGR